MPNSKEIREEFFTLIEDLPLPLGAGVDLDVERCVVSVTLGSEIAESCRCSPIRSEDPRMRMAGMLSALGGALESIVRLTDPTPYERSVGAQCRQHWRRGGTTLREGDRVALTGSSWGPQLRGRYGNIQASRICQNPVVAVDGGGEYPLIGDFSTRVRTVPVPGSVKHLNEYIDRRVESGKTQGAEAIHLRYSKPPLDKGEGEESCVDHCALKAMQPQSEIQKVVMSVDLTEPCDECQGTGWYTGLREVSRCSKGCVAS